VVTLYKGLWYELEHDTRTRKPYLGVERPNIHKCDGESLPSDNEWIPESSDEEPAVPRPQPEDSSDNELTQCYAPPIEQTVPSPTASATSYTYYRGGSRELLLRLTFSFPTFVITQQTHVTVYYYLLTRSCDSLVQIHTEGSFSLNLAAY
jgi:hypothetical protein